MGNRFTNADAALPVSPDAPPSWFSRLPFYYGWVNVVLGAMAMLATLPGRTQGLGLVTEQLLVDLNLNRNVYAQMNLWATLLGALCCLPVGQLLDRYGSRRVLVVIVAALALTVWCMSAVTSAGLLFVLMTLTRGLGQSTFSVVSIALIGKWFPNRISLAMGVYAVLVGLLFATAFVLVGWAVRGARMANRVARYCDRSRDICPALLDHRAQHAGKLRPTRRLGPGRRVSICNRNLLGRRTAHRSVLGFRAGHGDLRTRGIWHGPVQRSHSGRAWLRSKDLSRDARPLDVGRLGEPAAVGLDWLEMVVAAVDGGSDGALRGVVVVVTPCHDAYAALG